MTAELFPPEKLRIIHGNALTELQKLPARSVQCVVTSPPYWGLRDYGLQPVEWPGGWVGCFGLEPTIEMFLANAKAIFAEVFRVLKKDGTLWLNMGDCHAASGGHTDPNVHARRSANRIGERNDHENRGFRNRALRPKNLIGMPWRLALALQEDGWYLRSDIIWAKPSPMPESVRDRPTKSHEYLFLMTRSARYYYDFQSMQEPVSGKAHARGSGVNPKAKHPSGWASEGSHKDMTGRYRMPSPGSRFNRDRDPAHQTAAKIRAKQNRSFSEAVTGVCETRNRRDVWTIASQPYPGAHFATFPPELVRRCILAGTKQGDVVLDIFGGSGTTGMVALEHGRRAILIEAAEHYLPLIRERCAPYLPTEIQV